MSSDFGYRKLADTTTFSQAKSSAFAIIRETAPASKKGNPAQALSPKKKGIVPRIC
jgi:hypothetical protein